MIRVSDPRVWTKNEGEKGKVPEDDDMGKARTWNQTDLQNCETNVRKKMSAFIGKCGTLGLKSSKIFTMTTQKPQTCDRLGDSHSLDKIVRWPPYLKLFDSEYYQLRNLQTNLEFDHVANFSRRQNKPWCSSVPATSKSHHTLLYHSYHRFLMFFVWNVLKQIDWSEK